MVLNTHGYNFIKYYIHRSKILFLDTFGGTVRDCWVKKKSTLVTSPPEACPSYPDHVKNICQPCDVTFREAKMFFTTTLCLTSHLDLCDFSSPSVSPPTLHFAAQLQIQDPWWNWDYYCAVHIFITFYELRCKHLHSYWSIDSFSLCLPLAWFLPRCTANRLKNVRWIHANNYTCLN